MGMHESRFQRSEQIAEGTMAFHFHKPAGFAFKPGQAVELILNPSAQVGPNKVGHAFSLVSAPFQDELVIATRMRDSAFKRALRELPLGTPVWIDGPFGSLTLHKKAARAAVFIAGGIGITPFMSILRQAAQDRAQRRLVLLYSNRRPEDTPFLDELQSLLRSDPGFALHATMTKMTQSAHAWNGATGVIDAAMVQHAIAGLEHPAFYLAGPPAMVEAMKEVLSRAGVDEDDIRSEDFLGY